MPNSAEFQKNVVKFLDGPFEKYVKFMEKEPRKNKLRAKIITFSYYFQEEEFLPLVFNLMLKQVGPLKESYTDYLEGISDIIYDIIEVMEEKYTEDEYIQLCHIISYFTANSVLKQDIMTNESFVYMAENGPIDTENYFLIMIQKQSYEQFILALRTKFDGRKFSYEGTLRKAQIQSALSAPVMNKYLIAIDKMEFLRK